MTTDNMMLNVEYLGQKYKYLNFESESIADGKVSQILAYLGRKVESLYVFKTSKSVSVTFKKNESLYDFEIRRLADYGFDFSGAGVSKGHKLNVSLIYVGERN